MNMAFGRNQHDAGEVEGFDLRLRREETCFLRQRIKLQDFYRNQLQRQLQIVFNGVINTLESSGFNNNRCIHQQSCGACILKQRAQAIHAETGFTRQERGPLLLREVGLQP